MPKFDIDDYFNNSENTTASNAQNQRYTKYLCKFLSKNNEELDVSTFAFLDIDDLLLSLISFMEDSDSFSKKTASQYIGNLNLLFKYLYDSYQIKNDKIYINGNFTPEFNIEAKKIIEYYNDANDKGTADEDSYKDLKSKIVDLENGYSYQEAIKGIDEFLYNNSTKGISLYRDIVSICATRMVIEFAFKNEVIRDLTINDIDLEKNIIKRGKYNLSISIELKNALSEYLVVRKYLLDALGKKQERLFVRSNGEVLASTPAFAKDLFEETIKSVTKSLASDPFARKRLYEMIKVGLSNETITEITGHKDTTLKQISALINNNETEYIQNKLREFLTNSCVTKTLILNKENIEELLLSSERKRKKIENEKIGHKQNKDCALSIKEIGMSRCVFCGEIKRAIADEWVLVQVDDDETIYLACKDCEGNDGKIKY